MLIGLAALKALAVIAVGSAAGVRVPTAMLTVGWLERFLTPLILLAAIPFPLMRILPARWDQRGVFPWVTRNGASPLMDWTKALLTL